MLLVVHLSLTPSEKRWVAELQLTPEILTHCLRKLPTNRPHLMLGIGPDKLAAMRGAAALAGPQYAYVAGAFRTVLTSSSWRYRITAICLGEPLKCL